MTSQCFWPTGCSDSRRCREFGQCVAAWQSANKDKLFAPAQDPSHDSVQWVLDYAADYVDDCDTQRHLLAIVDELSRSRGELAEAKAEHELLHTDNEWHKQQIGALTEELTATRAERDAAVALVAKLEAVVRDGIEHVESDAGAWGGWLVRAQMALRAIKKQGNDQ